MRNGIMNFSAMGRHFKDDYTWKVKAEFLENIQLQQRQENEYMQIFRRPNTQDLKVGCEGKVRGLRWTVQRWQGGSLTEIEILETCLMSLFSTMKCPSIQNGLPGGGGACF